MDYTGRQRRLSAELERRRLDALLVTHPANVRYLCGFTGSAGALIARAQGRAVFITDGRYTEQARAEVEGARVAIAKAALTAEVGRHLSAGTLAIEAEHVTLATRAALRRALPTRVRLKACAPLVEDLRAIKDADELRRLRAAVKLGAELFEVALRALRPGVTEAAVAAEMEHAARAAGAEGMSFDTIVAAGPRSALPHGRASQARVPRRGFCVLDFGVILAGYCSDMTRTVWLGRPEARARRIYQAVREAQQGALEAVRAGVPAGQVDKAARRVLERAGWGRFFPHSTGHGVGLEIHEPPRLGRHQDDLLRPGMVVTIEPGVYVPGYGGVRIEDMVVVTATGCEVLTPTSKELVTIES